MVAGDHLGPDHGGVSVPVPASKDSRVNEENVSIPSAGLNLSGIVRVPDGVGPGERRAAFLVLHGFGSNKDSGNVLQPTKLLGDLGYVTLRFDMRGCGKSEGEHGRIMCLEQVEDTGNALTFMSRHPNVDPQRIGVIGTSFGGAVAVYAGGVDARIAAVISNGGWGDGERKFRGQHATPKAWAKFAAMLEEGRAYRARTGQSLMVPRQDIVPIPAHVRDGLAQKAVQMFPSDAIQSFPAETAQSMYDFRADDVVGRIAPRPLLLLHSANDSVTPTEQSIEMFRRAGQPTELHLFSGADHFMFAEGNTRVWGVLRDWLREYFPSQATKAAKSA
jgi:pimeloyl-ACP methyl ester carboxylesterase